MRKRRIPSVIQCKSSNLPIAGFLLWTLAVILVGTICHFKFSSHKIHGHNTLHNLEKQRLIVRKLLVPIPKKNVVRLINQRSGMAETLGCEILRQTLMSSSLSPAYLITITTFSALELLLLHMKYEFSLIDFYVSLISRYS